MKYQVFERIIFLLQKMQVQNSAIYKAGVDITEALDPLNEVIGHLTRNYYGTEGADWIDWFCYEKDFGAREEITANDKDGNEICRNVYELWELVEDCREDAEPYDLKKPMSDSEREELLKSFFNFLGKDKEDEQ
jgi:hypothetical protein